MNDLLNKITQGDCLEAMCKLPDASVDLIVIDPPYNIGKDKRWDKWLKADDYVAFMSEVFKECERVLKPTGSFYWFHNDMQQVTKLMQKIESTTGFIYKQLITIDKPDNSFIKDLYGSQKHFRNFLNLAEYCLFYTLQDESEGSPCLRVVQDYLESKRIAVGASYEEMNRICGYKAIARKWCADYKQPRLIQRDDYEKLSKRLHLDTPYEDLISKYESLKYKFNASDGVKNVWSYSFREDKKTKHPTQKPVRLIEDIIKYSSNDGDIILDCFLGSGTTAVAAINTGRHFIGVEREPEYVEIANKRIAEALAKN
jgi:DNA modification methylase